MLMQFPEAEIWVDGRLAEPARVHVEFTRQSLARFIRSAIPDRRACLTFLLEKLIWKGRK